MKVLTAVPVRFEVHFINSRRYARDVIIETPRGTETTYENRVATNGVMHKGLEVFYTGNIDQGGRGYGVWCREPVEQGVFLATYVGEILTIAGESASIFQTNVAFHEILINECGGHSWAEAEARGDTAYQLTLQIEPKGRAADEDDFGGSAAGAAAHHAWPAAEYVVDAKRKGNLSRFLNHDGASPNVFAQIGAPRNQLSLSSLLEAATGCC